MGRYIEPTQGEKIVKNEGNLTYKLEIRKNEKFAIGDDNKEILYVIDKKNKSQAEFEKLNPENIESIEVIKNTEDIMKYSTGDFDGAIVITLKKKKSK